MQMLPKIIGMIVVCMTFFIVYFISYFIAVIPHSPGQYTTIYY